MKKPSAIETALIRIVITVCVIGFTYWLVHFSRVIPIEDHPTFEQELDAAMPGNATPIKYGAVGSPAQDLRAKYAAAYDHARNLKLAKCDHCEACGKTSKVLAKSGFHLETHHVISVERIFSESLDPILIGDVDNLVALCRGPGGGCHLAIGHLGNFKDSNPNVRRDAAAMLRKTVVAP